MTDSSITFIGGGNMAACLIEGLLAKGHSPQSICVSDINSGARKKIEDMFQVTAISDNVVASKDADIIVLAVKPETLGEVAKELAPQLRSHSLIVSIAAGIPVRQIVRYVGKSASIVRAMPNTPAVVLSGATGLYANPKVLPSQKTAVEKIFNANRGDPVQIGELNVVSVRVKVSETFGKMCRLCLALCLSGWTFGCICQAACHPCPMPALVSLLPSNILASLFIDGTLIIGLHPPPGKGLRTQW